MEICQVCKTKVAACCCICRFPLNLYCDPCFFQHQSSDFVQHFKLPISAQAIETEEKRRQLNSTLLRLAESKSKALEISTKWTSTKEQLDQFFDELAGGFRKYQWEIAEEVTQKTQVETANVTAKVLSGLPVEEAEVNTLSALLKTTLSAVEADEHALHASSPERIMQWIKDCTDMKRSQKVRLEPCLTSTQSLGVFSFHTEALVNDLKAKIQEVMPFSSRFDLFYQDTLLKSEECLGTSGLPDF